MSSSVLLVVLQHLLDDESSNRGLAKAVFHFKSVWRRLAATAAAQGEPLLSILDRLAADVFNATVQMPFKARAYAELMQGISVQAAAEATTAAVADREQESVVLRTLADLPARLLRLTVDQLQTSLAAVATGAAGGHAAEGLVGSAAATFHWEARRRLRASFRLGLALCSSGLAKATEVTEALLELIVSSAENLVSSSIAAPTTRLRLLAVLVHLALDGVLHLQHWNDNGQGTATAASGLAAKTVAHFRGRLAALVNRIDQLSIQARQTVWPAVGVPAAQQHQHQHQQQDHRWRHETGTNDNQLNALWHAVYGQWQHDEDVGGGSAGMGGGGADDEWDDDFASDADATRLSLPGRLDPVAPGAEGPHCSWPRARTVTLNYFTAPADELYQLFVNELVTRRRLALARLWIQELMEGNRVNRETAALLLHLWRWLLVPGHDCLAPSSAAGAGRPTVSSVAAAVNAVEAPKLTDIWLRCVVVQLMSSELFASAHCQQPGGPSPARTGSVLLAIIDLLGPPAAAMVERYVGAELLAALLQLARKPSDTVRFQPLFDVFCQWLAFHWHARGLSLVSHSSNTEHGQTFYEPWSRLETLWPPIRDQLANSDPVLFHQAVWWVNRMAGVPTPQSVTAAAPSAKSSSTASSVSGPVARFLSRLQQMGGAVECAPVATVSGVFHTSSDEEQRALLAAMWSVYDPSSGGRSLNEFETEKEIEEENLAAMAWPTVVDCLLHARVVSETSVLEFSLSHCAAFHEHRELVYSILSRASAALAHAIVISPSSAAAADDEGSTRKKQATQLLEVCWKFFLGAASSTASALTAAAMSGGLSGDQLLYGYRAVACQVLRNYEFVWTSPRFTAVREQLVAADLADHSTYIISLVKNEIFC